VVSLIQRVQRRIDMRTMVEEVTRFIELELDFPREVRATERLAKTLADWPDVVVPRVYTALCGQNTIVLEYLDGIQVARTGALVAAGHKLPVVARKIGALYGSMIFEHGFFHADPHPGNLLVLPDGRIGLLDFGLCKELPPGFARRADDGVGDDQRLCASLGRRGSASTRARCSPNTSAR
jgi:ubiquinone biosynthesis protein